MVLAEAACPARIERRDAFPDARPNAELDRMALAVIEADRLHSGKALERPYQADGRILPAGEQDQRAFGIHFVFSNSSRPISMRRISLVPAPIS